MLLVSFPWRWSTVMRLIIAVVAGLAIAVVAVVFAENLLASAANGTPTNATLYVYGSR
jgi:K+-transporting ATPase c subunit